MLSTSNSVFDSNGRVISINNNNIQPSAFGTVVVNNNDGQTNERIIFGRRK
jgi:hypothetical protein